jgi:hypothetical protein
MSLFIAWIERLLPALTVTAAVLSAAAMTAYLLWNLRRKRDAEVESQKDPYEPGAREEVRRRWAPIFPIVRLAGVTAALAVAGTLALFLGSVDHGSGPGGVAPPSNAGPDVSQPQRRASKDPRCNRIGYAYLARNGSGVRTDFAHSTPFTRTAERSLVRMDPHRRLGTANHRAWSESGIALRRSRLGVPALGADHGFEPGSHVHGRPFHLRGLFHGAA